MAHSSTLTGPTTSAQHPPTRTHPMVTRAQVGTVKPNLRFNFHMSHISPLPKSPSITLSGPNWRAVMYDEYNALVKNSTWMLVPKPPNANVVGIDCDDTFSLVVKPTTIQTVLSLALSRGWHVHELDVKNTFLNEDLSTHAIEVAYLLIYVDDIILIASSIALLRHIISSLLQEFKMTDLGALNYFLGFLLLVILQTPIDTVAKLGHDEDPVLDPILYRSLASGLLYLTFTRLDISYHILMLIWRVALLLDNPLLVIVQFWMIISFLGLLSINILYLGRGAKIEYQGVANAVDESAWIHNLLRELHSHILSATLVYCDNINAIYLSANHVQHQRTKHIEIDIHFVRDMVTKG
ncbi:ribonuclease H-like domain-containing protein [Tanacetum coccineum]